MSQLALVILFAVIAVAFVWWSVKTTTTKKVQNEKNIKLQNTIIPVLLLNYGVDTHINGILVKKLPDSLQASVDAFLND